MKRAKLLAPMRAKHWMAAVLFLGAALAGCVASESMGAGEVREIRMWVEQTDWEIHPGQTTTVWAFCAEGDGVEPVHEGPCGVPGPTVRVTEGDLVRLTFENTHTLPHTVHFHGWHGFQADMNGNAPIGDAMVVDPGETQTIEWVAEPAGSFIYHCHVETNVHMDMGMVGAFIVEEKGADEPDVDHVMVLDEWALNGQGFHGATPVYDTFTINGKSFPLTQPILADEGDHVRLHMVNAGYKFHAMHLHGYTPDSWEGVAGPEHAVPTDVRTVAPGQTVVLSFTADRPGVWLLHDHVVPHVTAGADGTGWGAYPRGMLTVLAVGEAHHATLEAIVPDLLAAAQNDLGGGDTHASHDHSRGGTAHGDHAHDHDHAGSADTSDAGGDGDDLVVDMRDFVYEPEMITVPAGTTVTWVNEDPVYHTVTFDDGSVDSGRIEASTSWSYTLEEPGTYTYHCTPHASENDEGTWKGMVGTVIVEEAA